MILIDHQKCTGCGDCLAYCSVGAIKVKNRKASVDPHRCTDCYVCVRSKVCQQDAMTPSSLETFIDQFCHVISDPTETTADTGVPGRGTEESKTNDVTGRVKKGEAGFAIDMGRPGVGCYLRDVEKVAKAVCAAGLKLEPGHVSPIGKLMTNLETGELLPGIGDKYFLSIIIEGKTTIANMGTVIQALQRVEKEIDTVFSLGLVLRVDEDGHSPAIDELPRYGLPKPTRGKVNVGLGRPLVSE